MSSPTSKPRAPSPDADRAPRPRPGPPDGKRARNRSRKTADLQGAALALFLESGIEAVSIDDIARAAGMAKASFYRYFDGKEALVAAMFEPLSETVVPALESCRDALARAGGTPAAVAAYTMMALRLAGALREHRDRVLLWLRESRMPPTGGRRAVVELAARVRDLGFELTRMAHGRGLLRRIDPAVSTLAVLGAVERLLFSVLTAEIELEPERIAADVISLVVDGLAP